MTRRISLATALVPVTALAVLPAGCSGTTNDGAVYTVKIDREMRSHVKADLFTTHTTAIDLLADEFHYTITLEARDAREGVVEARTAKNRTVRVESYKVADETTVVDIWVGPLGDAAAELDILNALQRRLGTTTAAVTEE
jgi:hypothetical protein